MVGIIMFLCVGAFFFAPIITLKAHSEVSYWHSVCVANSAKTFARELGYGHVYSFICFLNGLFHDVGKILVPAEILHKNGKLTNEEFAMVKSHASNWLARVYGFFFPACIGHHVDFAGTGYGAEKVQSKISAIIEICDVHNAISGYFRTYRPVTEKSVVIEEMYKSEFNFDSEMFEVFMNNIDKFDVSDRIEKIDAKMRAHA